MSTFWFNVSLYGNAAFAGWFIGEGEWVRVALHIFVTAYMSYERLKSIEGKVK